MKGKLLRRSFAPKKGKTIAEMFVFVDFDPYYTEPDNAYGSVFGVGVDLLESSSWVGAYTKGV